VNTLVKDIKRDFKKKKKRKKSNLAPTDGQFGRSAQ
jgi:hypothetical protein